MFTCVPKDEHDFCLHIIRKRIPLPKSWGGDFCCHIIRKSPYIIITGGIPGRHHPDTDRRPFLRSADRALRANPQYFSNQKHIIMKKIKTCDYVAPECEEYSMIPEKGVFMSDNLIETETPDVETW